MDRFLEFAATIPPMPTSLLASSRAPKVSPAAQQAAWLIAMKDADAGRVLRVAQNLDKLTRLKRGNPVSLKNPRRVASK